MKKDTVIIDLVANTKVDAINEMTKVLDKAGRLNSLEGYVLSLIIGSVVIMLLVGF